MAYGITSQGFARKPLSKIKASIEARLKASIGEDINLVPGSVFSQIIGNFSLELDEIWQLAEAVYDSAYPKSAFEASLDKAVQYTGVTRLSGVKTIATIQMTGTENANIPAGTLFSIPSSGSVFSLDADTLLSASSAVGALLTVTAAVDTQLYEVKLSDDIYQYTAGPADTEITIAAALAIAIDTGGTYTVVDNLDGSFSVSHTLVFILSLQGSIDKTTITSQGGATCTVVGPIVAPALSITAIDTPVSGLDAVTNISSGVIGRNIETDEELRIRREQALRVTGSGTGDAIRSRILQEVIGVTDVVLVQNRSGVADGDGRPAHSFEVIVSGGADQDIGEKIWEFGPAGIQPYGNTLVVVEDSQGFNQNIYFSRATPIYIWVNIDLTLYDEEEFPADGLTQVEDAILAHGDSLSIGTDVLVQRIAIAAQSVVGIAKATITVATSAGPGGPPGAYTANDLAIDVDEVSSFSSARTDVQVV